MEREKWERKQNKSEIERKVGKVRGSNVRRSIPIKSRCDQTKVKLWIAILIYHITHLSHLSCHFYLFFLSLDVDVKGIWVSLDHEDNSSRIVVVADTIFRNYCKLVVHLFDQLICSTTPTSWMDVLWQWDTYTALVD